MDNYDAWIKNDNEKEKELEKRQKCCYCEEPIQTEYAVCICGDWYCDECLDEFRKEVPVYEF